MRVRGRAIARTGLRVSVALLSVAALTYVAFRVIPVNATTVGFFYLVTILLIARHGGLIESIAASFAAAGSFNFFFLPPILKFTIADPQNWVALFAFLATAILVSKLSTTVQDQTKAALDRQIEMERLYALSRGILLIENDQSVAKQAARQIARAFDFAGVSLYERVTGEIHRAGTEDLPDFDDRLREVALQGSFLQDPATKTVVTAIRLGADPIASLALRGDSLSDSALQSLSNLVAIALERSRAIEAANQADVARQSDQLKSTLLDAIAHEFKTPLTSIKAAATALLETTLAANTSQKELVTIVDEEADRLGRLVTEAIQMARIEAGRVYLNRKLQPPGDIVANAIAGLHSAIGDRQIHIWAQASLPPVEADSELIELALRLIIDNALKYSPPASPITIRSRLSDHRLVLAVHNEGPGIPESEQPKIFSKFYRASQTNGNVPGTGMGLAIARDIVQAHQGQIWVESSPGQGSEFCLSLPLALEDVSQDLPEGVVA
jgi:two-component system, OmpR family, sensor histidine kinase KdpD